MEPRLLTDDEQRAWQAVRLRLNQSNPALGAALYRAVPVAVDGLHATSSGDRFGRVYVDFTLEREEGIEALTDAAEQALASWLRDGGSEEPWHVSFADDDFDAVEPDELETLAALTAARMIANPPSSGDDDSRSRWHDWAEKLTGRSQVPWQNVLAGMLRRSLSFSAGAVDYSYSRPSRRRIPGVATPAMRHPLLTVAIVADVSPSVSFAFDMIGQEIERVARAAGVDGQHLHVIPTDDQVRGVYRYKRGFTLPEPDNATDMREGIAAALKLRPRPDAIVVLTDAATPWPDTPTPVPLIVALVRPNELQLELAREGIPAWAQTVEIKLRRADVAV